MPRDLRRSAAHAALPSTSLDSLGHARHLFVDWDGCLVERGLLRRGAYRFLRRFGGRVSILSNNSTDTPARLSEFLARHHVDLPPERFFLAGDITLRLVAARAGRAPVHLLANEAMREHARALGLRLQGRNPREVVLLRDTTFTFDKLERTVNLLRDGRPLIVANPDTTHPRGSGAAPETGALLAALASCVDLHHTALTIVGKPQPTLFERALAACGCGVDDVVMIGDGVQTDIAGAERMGIASVRIGGDARVTLDAIVAALLDAPLLDTPQRPDDTSERRRALPRAPRAGIVTPHIARATTA